MRVRFPDLQLNRTYHRDEVPNLIADQAGTSDFDVMRSHFPKDPKSWKPDSKQWMQADKKNDPILLQYNLIDIEELQYQFSCDSVPGRLSELADLLQSRCSSLVRIEKIEQTLNGGGVVFPVMIQHNDPYRRILEGHHRAVALLRLGASHVPIFRCGYRDWWI